VSIKFKNPPIHELVIGARFDPPLLTLRSEHIGLLWQELREDFPTVQQHPPLGQPDVSADEFLPMPRFWLLSEEQDNLIQVQKNGFMLNWRKGVSSHPHFSGLKPEFDRYFDTFAAFAHEYVTDSELKISQCELTYLDVIRPCDYWGGPADTARLIPSFATLGCEAEDGTVSSFNCSYDYRISPDLILQVAVRTPGQENAPDIPVLVLELSARGQVGGIPKSETDEWYDRAHDTIVDYCLRMTDDEIQRKHWAIEEASA